MPAGTLQNRTLPHHRLAISSSSLRIPTFTGMTCCLPATSPPRRQGPLPQLWLPAFVGHRRSRVDQQPSEGAKKSRSRGSPCGHPHRYPYSRLDAGVSVRDDRGVRRCGVLLGHPPCPERASGSSPPAGGQRPISAKTGLDRLAPRGQPWLVAGFSLRVTVSSTVSPLPLWGRRGGVRGLKADSPTEEGGSTRNDSGSQSSSGPLWALPGLLYESPP